MNSILITGCNRGIGLGLVRYLTEENIGNYPKHIFATCRSIEKAQELQQLAAAHSNIKILEIDVTDESGYERIVKEVSDVVQEKGLNLLVNNAGANPRSGTLNMVNSEAIIESFKINTLAPIMLTKAFTPLLRTGAKNQKAVVVNVSSVLGSIAQNLDGGKYAYRVGKAGLNAATKSMSIDLKSSGIVCIALHPGWVRTDMGGQSAPLDVKTSCRYIVNTIFELQPEHNGCFLNYDGKSKIPW